MAEIILVHIPHKELMYNIWDKNLNINKVVDTYINTKNDIRYEAIGTLIHC